MKMKKIVSFFLTALLTMSMAACGTNTEKAPTKTESTPAAQEEHKEDAKEVSADDKVIRVATPGTYRPFTIMMKLQGNLVVLKLTFGKKLQKNQDMI